MTGYIKPDPEDENKRGRHSCSMLLSTIHGSSMMQKQDTLGQCPKCERWFYVDSWRTWEPVRWYMWKRLRRIAEHEHPSGD